MELELDAEDVGSVGRDVENVLELGLAIELEELPEFVGVRKC